MADIEQCIRAFKDELSWMSADDMRDYVREVQAKAREYPNTHGVAAIKRAQEEVKQGLLKNAFEMARVAENNIQKVNTLARNMLDNDLAIRETLSRRYKNLGNNVESRQKGAMNRLYSAMFDKLSPQDFHYMTFDQHKYDIADAYDGKKDAPEPAKRVAAALKEYIAHRNGEMVGSGAMLLEHLQGNRTLRATHNRSSILNGGKNPLITRLKSTFKLNTQQSLDQAFNAWYGDIRPRIDPLEMFDKGDVIDDQGNIDEGKLKEVLNNVFNNIVQGKKDSLMRTGLLKDIKDLKARRRMFFHWKDMRSYIEYNDKYGTGNFMSAVMSDIQSSANRIGMSELYGMFPDQAYSALERIQRKEGKQESSIGWSKNATVFKYLSGDLKTAVSPDLAAFGSNLRSYSSMARLGGLVLQSLTDANIGASYVTRFDQSYGRAFMGQIKGLIGQFNDDDIKLFAKQMHFQLQHQMGYIGKFADAQNLSNITAKISSKYYRAIGMVAWDNGNRLGAMASIGKAFGNQSDKAFKSLSNGLQKQLVKHNISPDEWNVLRKSIDNRMLTMDVMDKLQHSDLRDLKQKVSPNATIAEYQHELYSKVFTLFDHGADNAILTPGAFIQAMMTAGTKPGSATGEIARTLMQFKGFALSYIDRALIGGWKNADGVSGKLLWAAQNFLYMVPLSYASTYFYNLSQGVSTPLNKDMALQILTPALGVYGQILQSDNQNSGVLPNMLNTPTLRLLGSALGMVAAGATGNTKNVRSNAKKILQYSVPGNSAPFISPFVKKYLLNDKIFTSPGQHVLPYVASP